MFCANCGKEVAENMSFCPECGAKLLRPNNEPEPEVLHESEYEEVPPRQEYQQDIPNDGPTAYYRANDPQTNRVFGIVSYLTWIGWIVAAIMGDKDDEFVKFHLNQSLCLNVISLILAILCVIPIVNIICIILLIVVFIVWLIAFINACAGNMKEVLFGKFIHAFK